MKDEKVVANSPVLARFFRLIEDSVWEGKWTNKEEGTNYYLCIDTCLFIVLFA